MKLLINSCNWLPTFPQPPVPSPTPRGERGAVRVLLSERAVHAHTQVEAAPHPVLVRLTGATEKSSFEFFESEEIRYNQFIRKIMQL